MQREFNNPDIRELQAAVKRACQPTHARLIMEGRGLVAKLPRDWILANIEQVGRSVLNFADYWEYGRFLEVLEAIEAWELIRKFVGEGLVSPEFDVRDLADLWAQRGTTSGG